MKISDILRGRRTNTVRLELEVIGSRSTVCVPCSQNTEHAILEAGLIMCTLCRRVSIR